MSYRRYRDLLQLADLIALDHQSNGFETRHIACALVYSQLFRCFQETDFALIAPKTAMSNDFNDISACFGDGSSFPSQQTELPSADANEIVLSYLGDFLLKAAGLESVESIFSAVDYVTPF
jgi:hypothetical protein